jgi:hypothetical protein
MDGNGNLPTCTESNGKWAVTYPDAGFGGSGGGGGFPAGFVVFFVIVGVLAVGTGIWRFSKTVDAAEEAGIDPGKATAIAMFGGTDLLQTSVLAKVAQNSKTSPALPIATESQELTKPTIDQRLDQLRGLHARGAITQEEYVERRREIIDSV